MSSKADKYIEYENKLIQNLKDATGKIKISGITEKYLGENLPVTRNEQYVRKFITEDPKTYLFIGMNPNIGSCGQTSVPFGEMDIVKKWMKIVPEKMENLSIVKQYGPGAVNIWKRFYKYFIMKNCTAEIFFRDSFVINFLPALFIDDSQERGFASLYDLRENGFINYITPHCIEFIESIVELLKIEKIIIVGYTVQKLLETGIKLERRIEFFTIPHPSTPGNDEEEWNNEVKTILDSAGYFSEDTLKLKLECS